MKRIYLIDCPGVVPPNMGDTEEDILLRGVVRVENVSNPEQYVAAAMRKVKQHHLEKTYDIKDFANHYEFLEKLARKGGRLLKGGEADMDGVAKMVLNDFLRGKIPWFTPPPANPNAEKGATGVDGREVKLGEMPGKKRKRDDDDEEVDASEAALERGSADVAEAEDEDDDDFSGFSEDDDEEDPVEEGVSLLEASTTSA